MWLSLELQCMKLKRRHGIFTFGWSSIWSSRTLRPPSCLAKSRFFQIQTDHDWSYELITPCKWWQDTPYIAATESSQRWGPSLDHESKVTTNIDLTWSFLRRAQLSFKPDMKSASQPSWQGQSNESEQGQSWILQIFGPIIINKSCSKWASFKREGGHDFITFLQLHLLTTFTNRPLAIINTCQPHLSLCHWSVLRMSTSSKQKTWRGSVEHWSM